MTEQRQRTIVGLDVGVKGSAFHWEFDQPSWITWDLSRFQHPNRLRQAIERGTAMALKVLDFAPRGSFIVMDEPVFPFRGRKAKKGGKKLAGLPPALAIGAAPEAREGGFGGYAYGHQCALFAAAFALLGVLGPPRGIGVEAILGRSARAVLQIRGAGKGPMIEWALAHRGTDGIGKLPKWQVETVSESFMLSAAGPRMLLQAVTIPPMEAGRAG